MAVEVGTGYLSIVPSLKGFEGTLSKDLKAPLASAGRQAGETAGSELRAGFLGHLSGLAAAAGGIFAAIGATRFLSGAIADARESAQVGRLTTSVIESTGEAAGVSAQQVDDLANALAAKTGIDDEVIQSGENVLLTFTNVRNEAGKGNDIFDQATLAATNMSAALGTDLQGSVIQLGKALNDPIKGITALQRVGVSFTEQQKEQIATLVEAGDTLGAQKIILAELSKEFGGAAEAAADPMARLQVIIGNFKESLGTALLPALSAVATALTPVLPVIANVLGGALGTIAPLIANLVTSLAPLLQALATALTPIIENLGGTLVVVAKALSDALIPVVKALAPILGDVTGFIAKLFTELAKSGILQKFGALLGKVLEAIRPLIKVGLNVLVELFHAAQPLLAIIANLLERLAPIIGQVAKAVAPLVQQLGKLVAQALKELAPSLPQLVDAFIQLVKAVVPLLPPFLKLSTLWVRLLPLIAQLVALLAGPLAEAIRAVAEVVTFLSTEWGEKWDAIKRITSEVVDAIVGFFSGLPDKVVGAIGDLLGIVGGFFSGVWENIKTEASDVIGTVIGFFVGLPGRIIAAIGDLSGQLVGFFTGALRDVFIAAQNLLGDIVSLASGVGSTIANAIASGFKALWNEIAGFINDVIPDRIHIPIPIPGIPDINIDLPDNPLPTFHRGGFTGNDPAAEFLTVLRGRELVVPLDDPRRALQLIGQSGLTAPAATADRTVTVHQHFGDTPDDPGLFGFRSARNLRAALRLVN